MLYKPSKGKIKDGCMIFASGRFYLFSMYHKEGTPQDFRNIWLAISEDGVHFKDHGCVVEDFPDYIWAMKVYRGEDAYYMNSGSFTKDGQQAVLKFWRSEDLIRWEYMPSLDLVAPNHAEKGARLDCMNVLEKDGRYYGYATGQFGYLESIDGAHWATYPSRMDFRPFPPYNTALGGFEVADCVEMDGKFYMLCGGFGHLGMNGYGVYLYESDTPDGVFSPCLPSYRLNGTSHRWVNMWERCFRVGDEVLCHNYMYDGHTYENGNVYLPPIKRLQKTDKSLCLAWWEGNHALYGKICQSVERLMAERPSSGVFISPKGEYAISGCLSLPDSVVIECRLTLSENKFTEYSCGGLYLAEDEAEGSAILFDTYGKCEIVHVKDCQEIATEDVIGFGSTAPYYMEGGKTYDIRILSRHGMFEIYVNDLYLQTFNNAHATDGYAKPLTGVGAISQRRGALLTDVRVYHMNL